jgi:hypothetical protein
MVWESDWSRISADARLVATRTPCADLDVAAFGPAAEALDGKAHLLREEAPVWNVPSWSMPLPLGVGGC